MLERLRVVVEERHVSRAAERLGISQPKLSMSLARLRAIVGDPLLVRTPEGMMPTPCARELAEHAADLMARIDGTLLSMVAFEPAAAERTFTLHVVDYLISFLLAHVLGEIAREAPGVTLRLEPFHPAQIRPVLEQARADLVIGCMHNVPQDFFISRIFSESLVCVVRRRHPTIQGSLSLDQLIDVGHVFHGDRHLPMTSEESVDAALAAIGLRRNIRLRVWSMLVMPQIAAASDLIATIPAPLAEQAAGELPLQVLKPPLSLPTSEISLIWHARTQNDQGVRWLREKLRRVPSPATPAAGRRRATENSR
jgi:DNA-binding transcriptional LysR family regulator